MNNINRKVVPLLVVGVLVLGTAFVVICIRADSVKRYPRIDVGNSMDPGELTFVLKTPLPAVPSQVQVYKVEPLSSKKEVLLKLIKALPLAKSPENDRLLRQIERTPEQLLQKEKDLSMSIGGWDVELFSGGQFILWNRDLRERLDKPKRPAPAPPAEKACKTADDFLARNWPLPFPVQFSKVSPGDMLVIGVGDTIVTKLIVSYSAEMNGIPTYGSVSIRVGAGPSVVEMTSRLRQVVADGTAPILSPQEAFDKLCTGEAQINHGPGWKATANVTSIKLVYWEGILAADLSYIMPFYIFEGDAVAKGKPKGDFTAFVDAVKPEFLEPKAIGDTSKYH